MPPAKDKKGISINEYLALEAKSSIRHEYLNGRIFAMTGATQRHGIITDNIVSRLKTHLKGGPCRAHTRDLKVKVEATNSIYYPDVIISCTKRDDNSLFAPDPVLIVEVLSPSTASIDRREKVL